jgi:hypothetical protein
MPEEHMRYVLLLAGRSGWSSRGQYDEMRAHTPEIQEHYLGFIESIQPRQIQEPKRVLHSIPIKPYRGVDAQDGFDWW